MASDLYLQIDGIKGESPDSRHQGWIEVEPVKWAVTQPKSATASTEGACTAGTVMPESVGLKFSKVRWKYTQQKVGGGMAGNTAGGWDLAANRYA